MREKYKMIKRLEIGPGIVKEKQEDTTYLDITKWEGIDIVRDIEQGLPFDNEKFDYIQAHHVLEHIKDLIFVMNELHRVLKTGGKLDIIVPSGRNAHIDPTHIRFFIPEGFNFFFVKDFNSYNAGVRGWFKKPDLEILDQSEEQPTAGAPAKQVKGGVPAVLGRGTTEIE